MIIVGTLLCAIGGLFFCAGAIGLLRLPDTLSRLHVLTKADNVGLGFLALGCGLISGDGWVALKYLFVWLTMLIVSSLTGVLIASRHLKGTGADGPMSHENQGRHRAK